jgi:hypothetical protein
MPDDEPGLTISTTYTPDGWTTTVEMPDGRKYRHSMRRIGGTGSFGSTGDGDFEDDDLPDCIIEATDEARLDIVRYLNE